MEWILGAGCLYCCYTDWRWRRIPNMVVMPAIVSGIIWQGYQGGIPGLLTAFGGLVTGVLLLLIPFAAGGMGAGDVKFLAAVGAWSGPLFAVKTLLAGAVAGGVMAVVMLVATSRLVPGLVRVGRWLWIMLATGFRDRTALQLAPEPGAPGLPYGMALAVGVLVASLW